MNVFAVLVSYNPSEQEIFSAAERLTEQCDCVVICNNSDNGFIVPEMPGCKVMNFADNLGIARAQSIGMKWAFDNGADFILQMDQDSILHSDTVAMLLSSYNNLINLGHKVGLIGPCFYDKVTNEVHTPRVFHGEVISGTNCISVPTTISSASLIPKEVYNEVGGMLDGLFIDVVDWEYCWRLSSKGYLIVRDRDIMLGHRVGNGFKKLFGIFPVLVPSPIRHYYHSRNLILLLNCNYAPLSWKLIGLAKLTFKVVFYPLGFRNGFTRLKFLCRGISDGILRKYGRIDMASRCYK